MSKAEIFSCKSIPQKWKLIIEYLFSKDSSSEITPFFLQWSTNEQLLFFQRRCFLTTVLDIIRMGPVNDGNGALAE